MSLVKVNEQMKKITELLESISAIETPKRQIRRRSDGLDYIEEAYMRHLLNKYFPVWSWMDGHFEVLGGEWILISGTLVVAFDDITRSFWSTGAARIQFKREKPHTAENVVDIDKNIAAANTNAFKRAINRLCNLGDDVYRKQISQPITEEQKQNMINLAKEADKLEEVMEAIKSNEVDSLNFEKLMKRLNKQVRRKTE